MNLAQNKEDKEKCYPCYICIQFLYCVLNRKRGEALTLQVNVLIWHANEICLVWEFCSKKGLTYEGQRQDGFLVF